MKGKPENLFVFLRYGILSMLLLMFFQATGQKFLAFDIIKGNKLKRIKYYDGDKIALKIKGDKVVYKGVLNEIRDTAFFVNDNFVMIDSVDAIVRYNSFAKGISYSAWAAALVAGIVSVLDYTLVVRGDPDVNPEARGYYVAPVMAGIGLIFVPFWKKTRSVGNNRILKVIDLSPK